MTTIGQRLLFIADEGTHGLELWRSDGTEAGTTLVKDINPGAPSSWDAELTYETDIAALGGALHFVAWDGVHGFELWRSDGTEAGTTLVKDINPSTATPYGGLCGAAPRILRPALGIECPSRFGKLRNSDSVSLPASQA